MPFTSQITPRFSQLDPAGLLFFGEVFTVCAGVYEDFLQSLGLDWDSWFRGADAASPVRKAEADYFQPLEGGRAYEVGVEIAALGTSSFEMAYDFRRLGVTHCRVRVVHVFVDPRTRKKMPIPAPVREAFSRHGVRPAPEAPSAAASPAASAGSPPPGAGPESAQTAAPGG